MSGYSSGIMAKRGIVEEGLHYIQKPLEMNALSATITKILQNPA